MNSKDDQESAARDTRREARDEAPRPRPTPPQPSLAACSLGALYMKRIIASLGDFDVHRSTTHVNPDKEAGS